MVDPDPDDPSYITYEGYRIPNPDVAIPEEIWENFFALIGRCIKEWAEVERVPFCDLLSCSTGAAKTVSGHIFSHAHPRCAP